MINIGNINYFIGNNLSKNHPGQVKFYFILQHLRNHCLTIIFFH